MNIKLPAAIHVSDYHEFGYIEDTFKQLGIKIKIREIGCDGYYWGIMYQGSMRNKKFKQLEKQLKKQIKESEE